MSLSDIEQRILTKLDDFGKKVDDLCNRLTKVEDSLDNHYIDLDEKEKNKEKTNDKKYRYIIAAITIGITLFEVIRSFFL